MKDRIFVWLLIPVFVIMTHLIDISLNYEIITLNRMIIDFIPYPHNNITCLGCCTLECLERAIITTLKAKILLPFFAVVIIGAYIIAIGIITYFEIKEEKRE